MFSILRNDFLSQITAQLELTKLTYYNIAQQQPPSLRVIIHYHNPSFNNVKLYREALSTQPFSILRNDFLSQITAQLELTNLTNYSIRVTTATAVTSSDFTLSKP